MFRYLLGLACGASLCVPAQAGPASKLPPPLGGMASSYILNPKPPQLTGFVGSLVDGGDGYMYGATSRGGAHGAGALFRVAPGGTLTTLHWFPGGTGPRGPLVLGSDGDLYGTTAGDFQGGNWGTVFRFSRTGGLTTVHTFVDPAQGGLPLSGLVQASDGNFYGTTQKGGTANAGTIYRVTPAGMHSVLHSFVPDEGMEPEAELVQGSDGWLYGTARRGGTDFGTVYRVALDGRFETLHRFNGMTDGAWPVTALVEGPGGVFYGTTRDASWLTLLGVENELTRSGTLYSIVPGLPAVLLHSFGQPRMDSFWPEGLAMGRDGNLYGTATYEFFRYDPRTQQYTELHTFGPDYYDPTPSGNGPTRPVGRMLHWADGRFYGIAGYGGPTLYGGVFGIDLGGPYWRNPTPAHQSTSFIQFGQPFFVDLKAAHADASRMLRFTATQDGLPLPPGATLSVVEDNPGTAHFKFVPEQVGRVSIAFYAETAEGVPSRSSLRRVTFDVKRYPQLVVRPSIAQVGPAPQVTLRYSAVLRFAPQSLPLAGRTVRFETLAGVPICTATTAANGEANCSVPGPVDVLKRPRYRAVFGGDGTYEAASANGPAVQLKLK